MTLWPVLLRPIDPPPAFHAGQDDADVAMKITVRLKMGSTIYISEVKLSTVIYISGRRESPTSPASVNRGGFLQRMKCRGMLMERASDEHDVVSLSEPQPSDQVPLALVPIGQTCTGPGSELHGLWWQIRWEPCAVSLGTQVNCQAAQARQAFASAAQRLMGDNEPYFVDRRSCRPDGRSLAAAVLSYVLSRHDVGAGTTTTQTSGGVSYKDYSRSVRSHGFRRKRWIGNEGAARPPRVVLV